MTAHPFWGKVEQDWAGFSAEITFFHPFFKNSGIEIFLGEEFDEDGEEIEEPPTAQMLSGYADTYKDFIVNIENRLIALQESAFDRYQKLYAKYYENPLQSEQPALNINNIEHHNTHIREIIYIRILDEETIKISIRYALDTEHGIEFKFTGGQIVAIGGIAET
ncbi:DUF6985 domain-containing protein [Pedobacter miscanthi]|jgi:hypothetical protein|uniref:DUF6985 domain-containing protein n=1 Tax=Pedobacter miscanthi TaxID=2259170 RepID=A0A366KZQ6_9SPHI|nr:hypothetical protein [Pedobacter miscanthi]RBQ06723.1 hypothetical protein DRW42_13145 [Pedobacter miscanthi]